MKWQKKLTKKELQHVKETTQSCTLRSFRANREEQIRDNITCFECEHIARKLGIEIPTVLKVKGNLRLTN